MGKKKKKEFHREIAEILSSLDGSGSSLSAVKAKGKMKVAEYFNGEIKQTRELGTFLEALKSAFEAKHPDLPRRRRRGIIYGNPLLFKKHPSQKDWESLIDEIHAVESKLSRLRERKDLSNF